MDKFFLSVLNMSLVGTFVIFVIMLARIPLKKAPRIFSYCLWVVVGFRLIFPFSIDGLFSLVPFKSTPIPQDIATQTIPYIDSGIGVFDKAVSSVLPAATPAASVNPLQIWIAGGTYIWLFGVALMLVYSIASIILLKCRLYPVVEIGNNIFEADNIRTPFVIGFFQPRIYIPAGLTGDELRYIILHEQAHIRRKDHLIKIFAYFVLCLHWFNPFVWAAFLLMSADMEMSCDERVMGELGVGAKNAYSLSLVRMALGKRILNGSPLAFGEGGLKERVKNILNFRKPTPITIVVAVLLVGALMVGLILGRTNGPDQNTIGGWALPGISNEEISYPDDGRWEQTFIGGVYSPQTIITIPKGEPYSSAANVAREYYLEQGYAENLSVTLQSLQVDYSGASQDFLDKLKDETVALSVEFSSDPPSHKLREIILTREEGGEWEVVNSDN